MAKKQYFEFTPLTLFLLTGTLNLFKVPYCAMATVLCGGITMTLYFPLSFWLFSDSGLPKVNQVLTGIAYSFATIALMFCFLHWANWQFECKAGYFTLLIMSVICLSNYKKPFYRLFLWRCIFFGLIITLLYVYREF